MKAPETAHSPGSAARANTKVSDGSRRMVRGSFNMPASSKLRAARLRIVPGHPRERFDRAGPVRRTFARRRSHQEIAVAVDAAAFARLTCGQPVQIIASNRLKSRFVPA